jgi:hypothetical protein
MGILEKVKVLLGKVGINSFSDFIGRLFLLCVPKLNL